MTTPNYSVCNGLPSSTSAAITIEIATQPTLPPTVAQRVSRWPAWLKARVIPPVAVEIRQNLGDVGEPSAQTLSATELWQRVLNRVDEQPTPSIEWRPQPHLAALLPPLAPVQSRLDAVMARRIVECPALAGRTAVEKTAWRAGVLLWHDALEESHSQSQTIEGAGPEQTGDYWHAIMHRREPDAGNAKYWFRNVGRHPVFAALAEAATALWPFAPSSAAVWKDRLFRGGWDPLAFVDLCEAARSQPNSPLDLWARQVQMAEILLLLDWSA